MASKIHSELESIVARLGASDADAHEIERCGTDLAKLGSAVTSQLESEFTRLAAAGEEASAA